MRWLEDMTCFQWGVKENQWFLRFWISLKCLACVSHETSPAAKSEEKRMFSQAIKCHGSPSRNPWGGGGGGGGDVRHFRLILHRHDLWLSKEYRATFSANQKLTNNLFTAFSGAWSWLLQRSGAMSPDATIAWMGECSRVMGDGMDVISRADGASVVRHQVCNTRAKKDFWGRGRATSTSFKI